ncbi:MAG: tRNA 2-thiouridine(34) synthase MnmA [Pseudomonadales bacterium]|nr:tRNA 2-thiouridine(34) synthase MnmA [Pseudomonadales bacterium]
MTQTAQNSASVIVGMSGGVDSSVAALLLLEQGYRVAGLFMKNWDEDDGTDYCTAQADLADAQQVCDALGIELHTANFAAEYWDDVFEYFLADYAAGRTPNPDVLCNREIKFKQFVHYAASLGADFIATGHYVRGDWCGAGPDRQFRVRKAADRNKDQSYFLQAVPLAALSRCLFPLGDLHKEEVRRRAAAAGFANHRKKDSTGICFIGERRFADFLSRYLSADPGPILDTRGNRVGAHRGLPYYTLGQRQGLGIGGVAGLPESPWYVVGKRAAENVLLVSQDAIDLEGDWLEATELNWLVEVPVLPLRCQAKIRYRQADQDCLVTAAEGGRLRVEFDVPQRAITPGQYVALYQGEVCLGGGVIEAAPEPADLRRSRGDSGA